MGRFINGDAYASTGQGLIGNNMFAYCACNPVMFADLSGLAFYLCTARTNDGGGTSSKNTRHPEGKYSNFNSDDLFSETETVYTDISKAEANRFYDTIKSGDYSQMISINPIPYLFGLSENYGDIFSLVYDLFTGASEIGYSDTYDPEGRLLYVEEGYNIVTLYRVFIGSGYSATETEYFVYDDRWHLVYNDAISDTYITD